MQERLKSLSFQITKYPGEYQIYVVENAGLIKDGQAILTQMTQSDATLRHADYEFVAQIVTKLKRLLFTGDLF